VTHCHIATSATVNFSSVYQELAKLCGSKLVSVNSSHEGNGKNMKKLWVSICLFTTSISAIADSTPGLGIAYNTKETNSITYRCTSTGKFTIDCEFTQTRVMPAIKEGDLANNLEAGRREFKNGVRLEKADCDQYRHIVGVLEGREKSKSSENSDLIMQLNNPDDIASFKAVLDFCENPTEDKYLKIVQLHDSKMSKTCLASSYVFEQSYRLMPETEVWVADSKPAGDCGVVDLSRFEPDNSLGGGFKAWNFIAKKTIANPKGTMLLGQACSGLDEAEYMFSWRSKTWPMHCDYIEFSVL